jgi:6-pyruvoyltetrahydropterin/6-carboxytetrahydropterin synthase
MTTIIGKEYKWEMSHRLPFHDGPCKNIHGHTYKLIVELEGELNEYSMVIDYYDVDRIFKPILHRLDHAFLCDSNDLETIEFLKNNGYKYEITNYLTTSENLVSYFLDIASNEFSKFENLYSITIRVYETADAYAQRTIKLK